MTTKTQTPDDSIVVLTTAVGEALVIRSNPTDKAVKGFVEEHTRRVNNGLPDGAQGVLAQPIYTAHRYADEFSWISGDEPIGDLKHLL